MIAKVRELDIGCAQVHGNGRRPSRADLQPIDPALLEEFNAGTQRAIRANWRIRAAEAEEPSLPCECGAFLRNEAGLAIHKGRGYCPLSGGA